MPSSEFRDFASKWGNFSHHFTRSAVAFRTTEGNWDLYYGFIAFSPEPINTTSLLIETKSLLVLRDNGSLVGSKEVTLDSTLADPCSLQFGKYSLRLPSAECAAQERYYALHLPRLPGTQRLPSISVTRQGIFVSTPNWPDLLTIDLELKAQPRPYDSLVELIAELGNPINAHEIGGSIVPHMEIVLAPPARITRGEIKDGILLIDATTSCFIDRTKLAFGLRTFSAKGTPVEHVPFVGTVDWEDTGALSIGHFQHAAPEIGLAQIFMTYDGEFLGTWWARDQSVTFSSRAALHKVIDTDNAFVAKFFDDRNAFEEHVLALLFLLKLDCLFYGKMAELKDGPDILASSDQGHLYVIECTTGGRSVICYGRGNNPRPKRPAIQSLSFPHLAILLSRIYATGCHGPETSK